MAKSKPRKAPGKKKPPKPKRNLRCGLVFRPGSPGSPRSPWMVDVTNFGDFRNALGDGLLVAFSRAFNLHYKLASIVDLMWMNLETAKDDPTRLERNLHTLGLFSCGVANELPEIITDLRRADVETALSPHGKKVWERLQRFERFVNHKLIKLVRNELAFHPGFPSTIQRGVEKTAAKRHQLVHVMQGDLDADGGSKRSKVRGDLGLDMLFAGLAIDTKDLTAAYTEIRDVHMLAIRTVHELFFDVMHGKGADIDPLGPDDDDEDA